MRTPYKGTGQAFNDVIGGQVQMMFAVASAGPQIKSGKVRALPITNMERSALFPGLPTVAESDVPEYEATPKQGIFAPRHLSRRCQGFFNVAVETVGGMPAELAITMQSEMVRMGKVIRDATTRLEP